MAASKKSIMGESSTANSTEDLTVDSPVSNQLVGSGPVKRTRAELSKDEGVAVHVSEDANVSGADSDIYSESDSDVDSLTSPLDSCSPYQNSISDLKKEKAELEEELKYNKEMVIALKLELARQMAKHEKLLQHRKEVANSSGVVGNDHIGQFPKE